MVRVKKPKGSKIELFSFFVERALAMQDWPGPSVSRASSVDACFVEIRLVTEIRRVVGSIWRSDAKGVRNSVLF